MERDSQRIAVVGAGIVGVATALWLRRAGRDVALVDRAAPGTGASHGNAGVLASAGCVPVTGPGLWRQGPRMALDPSKPLFLRWSYLPRLMPWLVRYLAHGSAGETERIAMALAQLTAGSLDEHRSLSDGTPAARYVEACDYVYLYRDRAAQAADAFGWALRAKAGFRWSEWDRGTLAAKEPGLSPRIGHAVALHDHGRISDPGAYVAALARAAEAEGVQVLRAEVDGVIRRDGAVTGLRAGGETIPCAAAVIATGAWSGALMRDLGLRVPLETERGYHLDLLEPSVMPHAPLMLDAGKFVIAPMEGRIRVAGLLEFGGLAAAPSRRPVDYLRRMLRRAMPALRWTEEREWMGHRPALTDSLPAIGPVPGVRGAFAAFGHHHVGLTSGPRTGRLIARMIAGPSPNLDVTPYAPGRFAS